MAALGAGAATKVVHAVSGRWPSGEGYIRGHGCADGAGLVLVRDLAVGHALDHHFLGLYIGVCQYEGEYTQF